MRSKMAGAWELVVGNLAAISDEERWDSGPASAMIWNTSS